MIGTMDMTKGRIAPQLIRFGVPLMLSSVLQLLYSLCDSLVVGRLIGVEAFAAVGAASLLSWLPMSMLLGMSHGFGVTMSQLFGAGDDAGLRWAAGLSAGMGLLLAMLMSGVGIVFLPQMLATMRTPAEILEPETQYLRVIFLGLGLFILYNVAASLLRAAGDSRTPLAALIVSTLLNIALDYILVAFAGMGVSGVALATVLAQLVSLLVCLVRLRIRPLKTPQTEIAGMSPGAIARQLLKLGMPPMLRDGVIAVGGLFVQSVVNGFGVAFVAGMTAARRYFSMMEMAGGALEGALATFVGQNAGAGNVDRVHSGTRTAVLLGLISSALTATVAAVFAHPLIALLVAESNAEVVRVGVIALRLTALFLPSLYLLCLYRASLQSMGDALVPMLSGFAEMALRIACVVALPPFIGASAAYFADGLGWVAAMILLMAAYYRRKSTRSPK